jgi:hypothetical protein
MDFNRIKTNSQITFLIEIFENVGGCGWVFPLKWISISCIDRSRLNRVHLPRQERSVKSTKWLQRIDVDHEACFFVAAHQTGAIDGAGRTAQTVLRPIVVLLRQLRLVAISVNVPTTSCSPSYCGNTANGKIKDSRRSGGRGMPAL